MYLIMTVTILGSGTSTGVPLIHCKCPVCRSKNPKNHRLRASAWIQVRGKSILIDTSPDLRVQAMRAKIKRIDAVIYTHPHADHVHGIDELRSFNYIQKQSIPVYGGAWTCERLEQAFPYIFKPQKYSEGGGVPLLNLHCFETSQTSLDIAGISVVPLSVEHGSMECVGYRIGPFAYLTDCSLIPEKTLGRMKGLSNLVLDCLRIGSHDTHLNLDRSLEVVALLKPKKTYLTHLGHDFDYSKWKKRLPPGVSLAYDGLKIKANF